MTTEEKVPKKKVLSQADSPLAEPVAPSVESAVDFIPGTVEDSMMDEILDAVISNGKKWTIVNPGTSTLKQTQQKLWEAARRKKVQLRTRAVEGKVFARVEDKPVKAGRKAAKTPKGEG